jgi:hypothetical protein
VFQNLHHSQAKRSFLAKMAFRSAGRGGFSGALGRCFGRQHGALKFTKNVQLSSFLGFWGAQLGVKSTKNVQLSSFLGFWGGQLGVKSTKNVQLSSFLGSWAQRVAKSPK